MLLTPEVVFSFIMGGLIRLLQGRYVFSAVVLALASGGGADYRDLNGRLMIN